MPLEWAAAWFTGVVFAATAWSASILYRATGGGLAGHVAAAALIAAPGSVEVIGSVTNLQWVMAPALLALISTKGAVGHPEAVAFALLSGLSGPFAAIFGPVIAAVFIYRLRAREIDWVALFAGLAGLVQLAFLVSDVKPLAAEPNAAGPFWMAVTVLYLSLSLSLLPIVAGAALVACCAVGEKRFFRMLLLSGLALAVVAVAIRFQEQADPFVGGRQGQRYWYIAGVLWTSIAASTLRESGRRLKQWGAVCLFLCVGLLPFEPFQRDWPWPTESWYEFVERARQGPAIHKFAPNWDFRLDLSK
jgi:hypothetical protein